MYLGWGYEKSLEGSGEVGFLVFNDSGRMLGEGGVERGRWKIWSIFDERVRVRWRWKEMDERFRKRRLWGSVGVGEGRVGIKRVGCFYKLEGVVFSGV